MVRGTPEFTLRPVREFSGPCVRFRVKSAEAGRVQGPVFLSLQLRSGGGRGVGNGGLVSVQAQAAHRRVFGLGGGSPSGCLRISR